MPEIRLTDGFIRFGVRDKEDFLKTSYRTHVLSENTQRVAGKLKRTGKWKTQALQIRKGSPDEKVVRLFNQANDLIRREGTGRQLSYAKLKKLL